MEDVMVEVVEVAVEQEVTELTLEQLEFVGGGCISVAV